MLEEISLKKLSIVFLLVGCASNPYSEFYIPSKVNKTTIETNPEIIFVNEPPHREILDKDEMCLAGIASFNGAYRNFEKTKELLLQQGIKVSADLVIAYEQYSNTVSGNYQITLPKQNIVQVQSNGYVGRYNYSDTTNINYTTQETTSIPYSIARYDYQAVFWFKCSK